MFVTDAHVADVILAAFRTAGRGEDGITLFLVPRDAPGVTIRPLHSIDLTRRPTEVRFEDVELPASAVLGAEHKGWKTLARLLDAAAVALAADSLGGAERALEMAVEYAKVREQFGRPIGSFQAVKHMAAEMVSEIEPARSLVWYAAYAYDNVPREASRAAAMAKAGLSEVYSRTTNRSVQIHGGIGFTWEHDLHFWFKRAKWNEFAFGDPPYHRERLAQLARF
jgi:alkylation response protein AidB-like acyl-CoA dehydrogenase